MGPILYLASSGLYCNQTTEFNTLKAISPSIHPQRRTRLQPVNNTSRGDKARVDGQ